MATELVVSSGIPCMVSELQPNTYVAVVKGEGGYHPSSEHAIYGAGVGSTPEEAAADVVKQRARGMKLAIAKVLHESCEVYSCTNPEAVDHLIDANRMLTWFDQRQWHVYAEKG